MPTFNEFHRPLMPRLFSFYLSALQRHPERSEGSLSQLPDRN
jgi:hypothetical protein